MSMSMSMRPRQKSHWTHLENGAGVVGGGQHEGASTPEEAGRAAFDGAIQVQAASGAFVHEELFFHEPRQLRLRARHDRTRD